MYFVAKGLVLCKFTGLNKAL